MPDVQPGNYDLKGNEGWLRGVKSNREYILLVNQIRNLRLRAQGRSVSELVEVQVNPVALETSTAELGVAVVKEQVNDLPLNGRNFTQVAHTHPGRQHSERVAE